jgi:hypothetical protein
VYSRSAELVSNLDERSAVDGILVESAAVHWQVCNFLVSSLYVFLTELFAQELDGMDFVAFERPSSISVCWIATRVMRDNNWRKLLVLHSKRAKLSSTNIHWALLVLRNKKRMSLIIVLVDVT